MESKKAVVMGASSGIGCEVVKVLLREGWTVGVAARREERLQALKALQPERVEVQPIDVTDAQAEERLLALVERLGGMDLYLHVSGVGRQNRTLTADVELDTMQANAVGFTRMVGAAYRYMVRQGHGHLAAVTSIAGTKGLGPAPAYSATKAMQNCYLQALEQQIHQRGLPIRVTDIRPGFVDTDLLAGDFRYPLMLRPERVAEQLVRAINRRQHVVVVDWKYRVLTALWRRVPRWLWRHIRL